MKKLAFIVLAFALLVSCKKNKDTQDSGASQADMDLYHHTLTLQEQAYENYVTWSQTMDSLAAINKLQQFFMSDPAVSTATISSQGVMVQYSNGFRGGIILNTEDNYADSSMSRDNYRKGPYGSSKLKSLVNNKKMIFLDPQSFELGKYSADIIENYNQNLPKVNYSLEVYPDEQANLDKFANLKGYGIIQIYTHGIKWTFADNTKTVYLMTGEEVSDPTTNKYVMAMKEGKVAYNYMATDPSNINHKHYYTINQDFITKYNDFSKDTILFMATFCNSYLGSWPNIQSSFAKVAYFGFEGSSNPDHAILWSTSLIDDLCDTTKTTPVNVQDWMSNSVSKWYIHWYDWDPTNWEKVTIKYTGDPTLALWKDTHGTFTDPRDGEVYKYKLIGTQVWMIENLRATKYNDGTAIPLVTDNTAWSNLTTPGYCWYNNDAATYKNTYGALYNWFTVNTGKLAPTGWHVPTDAEWTTLTTYLGGESAGGKLKSTGTIEAGTGLWYSPNTGATNESGFTAVPAGSRIYDDGAFGDVGYNGYWWSSSESNTGYAWFRYLYYDYSGVYGFDYFKSNGFSVRCVRD